MQSLALKNMVRTLVGRSPRINSAIREFYRAATFQRVAPRDLARESERLTASWMDGGIPGEQWAVVAPQLAAYRAGNPSPTFDALVDILVHNISNLENKSLLEIGCSSGYYAEVLRCRGIAASYQGCDFSPAFVHLARQTYPSIRRRGRNPAQLRHGLFRHRRFRLLPLAYFRVRNGDRRSCQGFTRVRGLPPHSSSSHDGTRVLHEESVRSRNAGDPLSRAATRAHVRRAPPSRG